MKKLFIMISALTLVIGLFSVSSAFANDGNSDLDDIYQKELSMAIVAGDGTPENPYVIDEEKAPMFTEYLEESGRRAVDSMKNPDITPFGIFDGVLNGTSHYQVTSGAYWNYVSGAPSAISDNTLWMKSVDYMSYNEIVAFCAALPSSSLIETFKGAIVDIAGQSLSYAITCLTRLGFDKTAAKALAGWVGCGTTYIGGALLLEEVGTFFKNKPYLDARDAKKGLLHIAYNTSYHGDWYAHSITEIWQNYPTAKEPSSYYGKGTYKVKS